MPYQPLDDMTRVATHDWANATEEESKGTVLMEVNGRYRMVPVALVCRKCGLTLGARGKYVRLNQEPMPKCEDLVVKQVMET